MKLKISNNFICSHVGENRSARRFALRFRKRAKKSYFVMPNEVIEKYRKREISAVDVTVYAALCSLRREFKGIKVTRRGADYCGLGFQCDGVRVGQERLARMCGLSRKTVGESVKRLYSCGLIRNVLTEVVKQKKKYKTSIYHLKPLPDSGFFFCPRSVFMYSLTPKMFALCLFMYRACDFDYGKSWNSYNDICDRLGFGKCQRSEVVRIIGELARLGILKKTVRRFKKVFVDNIYRVSGFDEIVQKSKPKEKHPVRGGVQFENFRKAHSRGLRYANTFTRNSIPLSNRNVKPFYAQLSIFSANFCGLWGGV